MKDIIEITITKEDAEKALSYIDLDNCLLATAGKRLYPQSNIYAGVSRIYVDWICYEIPKDIRDKIRNSYEDEDLLDNERVSLENFKPFTFTATRVK